MRKSLKSTKTQPKRQRTAPSSPPHPAPWIQADLPSPPHPAPQTQVDLANVSEQVIDLVDLGTSSAVPPEETIVIPPQGKILIIKSLQMALLQRPSSPLVISAEDIPTAVPTDQGVVQVISPF